jgi:hypothetical protein
MIKCVDCSSCKKTRCYFQILIKPKFHENPSVGAKLFHTDGQTDGQT